MKKTVIPVIRIIFCIGMAFMALPAMAQDSAAVQVALHQQRTDPGHVRFVITAKLKPGVKLFALQQQASDQMYSTLAFDSSINGKSAQALTAKGQQKKEYDSTAGGNVAFYTDSVSFEQVIAAQPTDSFTVKGLFSYFYKTGNEYLTGEKKLKFFIMPEAATAVATSNGVADNKSLWWVFFTAFAGGLLALLTPCVYSMIPVTVSFFTKRSKTKAEGIRNALYYAASIILIFTGLGFLVTIIFGPAALNHLATNWIANLVFFVLFIVFGFSFLGAFEISLPASWSTKADTKAGMGSFAGIFFMALTLVLVSFSCTGPIIGNLLVMAAKGSYYGPLIGMFGFSLALALPFALFAFFPSKLNVLGKAGGWLNAVKVTLGFLELALALKFLSNADLAKGWRLLDREVFIVCWVGIFAALSLYLFGLIRFKHDDQLPVNDFGLPHLSVTRLVLALSSLFFALYMMPGLWGAPLKGISAFVPPMGTQDFTGSAAGPSLIASANTQAAVDMPHPQQYAEQMKKYEPEVVTKYGMVTYFDYQEALAVARKLKKPLMLDFTGINCVNCRKMEGQVWSDPAVMQRLKNDFVIVSLYADAYNIDLPPAQQYFSRALNKQVETLGDKNSDLQVSRFGSNAQPYYFFVDAHENKLAAEGYGYDPDIDKFIRLLDEVKKAYDNQKD